LETIISNIQSVNIEKILFTNIPVEAELLQFQKRSRGKNGILQIESAGTPAAL